MKEREFVFDRRTLDDDVIAAAKAEFRWASRMTVVGIPAFVIGIGAIMSIAGP